jgi:DHA1 family bicyclomycin/chloramphenicol resistance-like MFS transporter
MNVDPLRTGSISAVMGGASFALGALVAGAVSALTTAFPDAGAKPMASVILVAMLLSAAALYGVARPQDRKVI